MLKFIVLGIGPVQTLPQDTANITNFNNLSLRYKLDLTADAIVKHGFEKFLEELNTNMNNYYATFGGVQDIVYNPFDATIYGYMSYRDGTQKLGGLIKLKQPDNGISVVQAITQTPNTSPGYEIAGLFINDQARMFGLFSNGNFAIIDMQDGVYHNIGQSNVITDYTLNGGTAGNLRGDIGSMPNTTVLPINLAYFKGKIEQSNHVFYWQTYSEDNNREFILEASNDGRTWE